MVHAIGKGININKKYQYKQLTIKRIKSMCGLRFIQTLLNKCGFPLWFKVFSIVWLCGGGYSIAYLTLQVSPLYCFFFRASVVSVM